MLRFPRAFFLSLALIAATAYAPAHAEKLGIGAKATPKQVKAWDIDVRPDGQGLPEGRGSVSEGERAYLIKCAACHGEFGEGMGRWPVLAGGHDTLQSENPSKTLGSYWPYLSTVYDYIYRAMPFGDAQSLTPNEVYAITAYLLNMNDLVDDDFQLSKSNFTSIRLPNEKNFINDPRPDMAMQKKSKPCMKNCKASVKITAHAGVIDVTPTDENNPTGGIN